MSRVKEHGEWAAMGITCGLHTDAADTEGSVCQTVVRFYTKKDLKLDDHEATLRLKRLVHSGYEISLAAQNARSQHKRIAARACTDGHNEDFLDGWAMSLR